MLDAQMDALREIASMATVQEATAGLVGNPMGMGPEDINYKAAYEDCIRIARNALED